MKRVMITIVIIATICASMFIGFAHADTEGMFDYRSAAAAFEGDGYVITSYNSSDKNVIVPSIINGTKVTAIADSVFENNNTLEEITLPDSIVWLGKNCFKNCAKLKSIRIPAGITELSESTFEGCSALEEVEIPNSVTVIGKACFKGCTSLGQMNAFTPDPPVEPTIEPTVEPSTEPSVEPTATPTPVPTGKPEVSNQEWDILKLVNKNRITEGLECLSLFDDIQSAADIRSGEIQTRLEHTRLDGSDFNTVLDDHSVSWNSCGENIAAGQRDAEEVMTDWMNSPGHRANILSEDFNHIGIGYVNSDADYTHYWTQLFVSNDNESITNLSLSKNHVEANVGTSLTDMDITITETNSVYGKCLLPLIDEMCPSYDKTQVGEQTISIVYHGKEITLTVVLIEETEPTATPTAEPTATPTAEPTATPTAEPTATPTAEPTATSTAESTATPTAKPTATPTAEPTATSTAESTATPTAKPTATPTAKPTATPTVEPTATSTVELTAKPTEISTAKPTVIPTEKPTAAPTAKPIVTPTVTPIAAPTAKPTVVPTAQPTVKPTAKPTATPTAVPTIMPTAEPTATPVPGPKTGTPISIGDADYEVTAPGEVSYTGPAKSKANVSIPDTITVDGETLKVTSIAPKAFLKDKKLKTVTIGANIETIGDQAFKGCVKLKTVKGGANVKTIGNGVFQGCKVLKKFPTMNELESIGASAFKGCAKLTKFTLGEKVNSIGKNTFNGCKALKTITVKTELLTNDNVGKAAFKGINSKATIKCPKESKKAYKKLFVKKGAPKGCKFK